MPPSETGSAASLNQVLIVAGGATGSAASIVLLGAFTPPGQPLPLEGGYATAYLAAAVVCVAAAGSNLLLMRRTAEGGRRAGGDAADAAALARVAVEEA